MRIRLFGIVGLAVLVLPCEPREGAAGEARLRSAVNELVRGLAAAECPQRMRALSEFFAVPGRESTRLGEVRKQLAGVDPTIAARVKMVLDFEELREKDWRRLDRFMEELRRISSISDPSQRTRRVNALRQRLLRIIANRNEPFGTRWGVASFMVTIATEFAPGLTSTWTQDIVQLLESPDPQVRLIGSLFAAGGMLHKGQDPKKGVVIPSLIEGLRGQSFDERDASQRELLHLANVNPDEFCLDPTDPTALRAVGIQRWETWWTQNKDALSDQRIPQMN